MRHLISVLILLAVLPSPTFAFSDVTQLPRDAEKEAWVHRTLAALGLSNDVRVVRDVSLAGTNICAFATVRAGIQWIAFDPQCVTRLEMPARTSSPGQFSREERQCIWSRGVLLHELGHQLAAHTVTLGKNDLVRDFEAEKWAGWAFAYSGATLDEALAYAAQGREQATSSHNGRLIRMKAVEQGWRQAQTVLTKQQGGGSVSVPPKLDAHIDALADAARRRIKTLTGK